MYYSSESSQKRGDGVPSHFVVSGSGNTGYLNINEVQVEDDAVYYCLTWTGSQYHSITEYEEVPQIQII